MKYCVNKNRPLLHCNGHCFLMRELKKEQQQEKSLNDEFGKAEVLICKHEFPKIKNPYSQFSLQVRPIFGSYHNVFFPQSYIQQLDKPPLA